MNVKSLCRCVLALTISFLAAPKLEAQTVDDTGSKWKLEQAVREEASRIRQGFRRSHDGVPLGAQEPRDFDSQAFEELIRKIEAQSPMLSQPQTPLNGGAAGPVAGATVPFRRTLLAFQSMARDVLTQMVTPTRGTGIGQRALPAFGAALLLVVALIVLVTRPRQKRRWLPVGAIALGCLVIAWSIGELMQRATELGR